ncbi:probable maleylacetoacetate isomerase 2 isoform X2 [Monomorium pharaonis]|uniref:probable maleylacetoacetate isomerase 2 isoform X2 n=1 Tax=Monomorium pharaonis TaxID=307658 RepID=UPI00063F7DD9|nr:probable maleylacetoacetate isomerase 2 isoform X2 [Monomorium pharaonis]
MSAMGKPVLYSFWQSSCSWRVRIALHLKEIPYDIKSVSLVKNGGEQHSSEFCKINPMERVPALHIDNHTLIESLNILQYLEETRPNRPLMPADPVKRARVREICEVIASGIQPLQNIGVLFYVGEERKLEWAQHWITKGFTAVEKLLSSSAGKYCVDDEITLADCCLMPQIYNARRYHVDLRPFPTILRVARHLEQHPAFIATHPNTQPDCPSEAIK